MLSNTARLALLLTPLACADGDFPVGEGSDPMTRSYTDDGSLCMSPRGAGGSHVQVLVDDCGSSCDDVEASCNASIVDGVIVVESEARAVTRADGNDCPTICVAVETACTLPELPDGNYELRYGSRLATITMPVPIAGTLVLLDANPSTGDTEPCERLPLLP
jgi:hypothetical protein